MDAYSSLPGEKQRVKKRFPPVNNPRRLAPYPEPSETGPYLRDFSIDFFHLTQTTTGRQDPSPDGSSHGSCIKGPRLQDDQDSSPNSCDIIHEASPFTFSHPQTLIPAHDSFVPKRRTPSSLLSALMRPHPSSPLWPHGAPSNVAAFLFNARALGIDVDRLFDPYYTSPFYRPSLIPVSNSVFPHQMADLEGSMEDNDHDAVRLSNLGSLRPCLAQMIFPHHACLDLLPLPKLREAAVMLNTRAQQQQAAAAAAGGGFGMSPDFNAMAQELKKDVYLRLGVRLRGSGEVSGGQNAFMEHHDARRQHGGQPWETGSWVVETWFARKWNYLVDI